MAVWHYYNENGDKITVTGKELKELARSGKITPGTMIVTEDGKTAPAKQVKGLKFSGTVQSKPIPEVTSIGMYNTKDIPDTDIMATDRFAAELDRFFAESEAPPKVMRTGDNLYYYNANGEKISVPSAEGLKERAKLGMIAPETIIENESGQKIRAGKLKGLTFDEPVQSEIYTMSPHEPKPPPSISVPPVAATPVSAFPVTDVHHDSKKNWWYTGKSTTSVPPINQTNPLDVFVPAVEKGRASESNYEWVGSVLVVCFWIGVIFYFTGFRGCGSRERESAPAVVAPAPVPAPAPAPAPAQPPRNVCQTCNGTGRHNLCWTCVGRGWYSELDRNNNIVRLTCIACSGRGTLPPGVTRQCHRCNGTGRPP
jgi:hypothetical protein